MNLAVLPCSSAQKATIGEHLPAGVARFLYHRKLLRIDLAVMPCLSIRKATIGEPGDAGTARFFILLLRYIVMQFINAVPAETPLIH